jgi:ribosomal protein S18 acetylase RimI-like enzyme
MSVVVLREVELPIESMTGLVQASNREGYRALQRLLTDYTRGDTYKARGEVILAAWERSVVIGLIAVRRVDEATARISALYVAPADRRRGVARELVRRATDVVKKSLPRLEAQGPDEFLSAVGFKRTFGAPRTSHARDL